LWDGINTKVLDLTRIALGETTINFIREAKILDQLDDHVATVE